MLVFLLTKEAAYTIDPYIEYWSPEFRDVFRVRTYESLPRSGFLDPGTYIFADQERWTPRGRRLAIELWDQFEQAGPAFVPLNNPRRVLLRFELLRALHATGQNRFNVYRPLEALRHARFPVFIHSIDGHEGSLTPLLPHQRALILSLLRRMRPRNWDKLIVEEFCDVSTSKGIYAKYGAFCFAGAIVPRQIFHGKNWMLKKTEFFGPDEAAHCESYVRDNPDEKKLRVIFEFAGIDFGRIDYAFHDGRLQVWEINTNPVIMGSPDRFQPLEIQTNHLFNDLARPHFKRLSELHESGSPMSYKLSGTF